MILITSCPSIALWAQNTGALPTLASTKSDSSNKTNTADWEEGHAIISAQQSGSTKAISLDTSLINFHQRPYTQTWKTNLGNLGSASQTWLLTNNNQIGPSLRRQVNEVYALQADSLLYFNTTKPFTIFSYQMGSKNENLLRLLHTQNIKPNFNMAFQYHKLTSPGFYKAQRNNHDLVCLNAHYTSNNKHYECWGAFIFNEIQQDENGGISEISKLTDSRYADKKTMPIVFQHDDYSTTRSAVTNVNKATLFQWKQSYAFGRLDSTWNEDSSLKAIQLKSRFSLVHQLDFSTNTHTYKDLRPDSAYYHTWFDHRFNALDSVYSKQIGTRFDNQFLLKTTIGNLQHPLELQAGIGARIDQLSNDLNNAADKTSIYSNYLVAHLDRTAIHPNELEVHAYAQFIATGNASGNHTIQLQVTKKISNQLGRIQIGLHETQSIAAFQFTNFSSNYYSFTKDLNATLHNQLYVKWKLDKLHFGIEARQHVLSNYIYLNAQQLVSQSDQTIAITQFIISKNFVFRNIINTNELLISQLKSDDPFAIPSFASKHQLAIQTPAFHNAMQLTSGIEALYHNAYYGNGYTPLMQQFYIQKNTLIKEQVTLSLFLNVKVKKLRAYIMFDQIQQLWGVQNMQAIGYAAPDFSMRFGFNWNLVN